MSGNFGASEANSRNLLKSESYLRIQADQGQFQNPLKKSTAIARSSSNHSQNSKFKFLRSGNADSSLDTQVQSASRSSNFIRNTQETAQNIGDFSGKSRYTWKDSLSSNSGDFFQFGMSNRGRVSLSLENLQGSANLRLLRSNGTEIKQSTGKSISSSLRSGLYYVQVSSDSSANYTLDMKGSGYANDAGSTVRSAFDSGNLTQSNRTFRRMIGGRDAVDVYRFDLSERSSVDFALGNLRQDASLQLLDSSGNEIAMSNSRGNTGESLTKQLNTGTYYVKVETASKTSMRYALEMSTGASSAGIITNPRPNGSSNGSLGGGSFGGGSSNGSNNGSSNGSFGGGSSNGSSGSGGGLSNNGDRSYLRLTKTNRTNANGLTELQLELVQNSKIVDKVVAIAGVPSKQAFRRPYESRSGSMEPLPEGKWSLGSVEWAGGRNNFSSSWGEGLGPVWVSMEPTMSTSRSAIGLHLDSNASYSPGTAGCVGVTNKTDLQKVVSWFDNSLAPKTMVVNWGLGTVVA